jgi:RES domain
MTKYYCTQCFRNEKVIEYIKKQNLIGSCSFCESTEVNIASAEDAFWFDLIISFDFLRASPDNRGFTLERFLTRQVDLLSETVSHQTRIEIINNLFHLMLYSLDINLLHNPDQKFIANFKGTSAIEKKWEEFKKQIKHTNRFGFDIDEKLKTNLVTILTNNKKTLNKGTEFYRARLGKPKGSRTFPYEEDQVMAPPKEIVSEGRINPRGVSYLYVTDDINTAISEVRPYKGTEVSLATVQIIEDIEITSFNNTNYHGKSLHEQTELYILTNTINFELSYPIDEQAKYLDYIPYQYISELAKHLGLEGLEYKSALEEGTNLCIFNTKKVMWKSGELYKIKNLKVEAEPVNQPITDATFSFDLEW